MRLLLERPSLVFSGCELNHGVIMQSESVSEAFGFCLIYISVMASFGGIIYWKFTREGGVLNSGAKFSNAE